MEQQAGQGRPSTQSVPDSASVAKSVLLPGPAFLGPQRLCIAQRIPGVLLWLDMASPLKAGSKPLPIVPVEGWTAVLQAAIEEVFSMMVGTTVGLTATTALPPGQQVAGVIGIGGAFTAVLSLRCSAACAGRVASQMLGVPDESDPRQWTDAIGEICNMVAGNFKAKAGHEADCMLSLPSVITGTNYSVYSAHNSEIRMCFLFDGEPILFVLDIRK